MGTNVPRHVMDPQGRDVHGEAAKLRKQGGVTRVELCGVPAWAVTSHDALKLVLSDDRVSRDPRKHWPAWNRGDIPREWPLYTWLDAQNMFTSHGDEHRRLRRVVSKTLTPRLVRSLQPQIEKITSDRLDTLETYSDGVVDLCATYTQEIPIQVFCVLMGIGDEETRARMCQCVHGIFHTAATAEEVVATHAGVHAIIRDLIATKSRNPGNDLTSALVMARDEDGGARLTEEELAGTLLVLMMGGYETTANLLGNVIFSLLSDPGQCELLRESVVSWGDVIEETMRFQPSVANLPLRFAAEDIELEGIVIPKGDAIIAGLAAASRDPAYHGANADRFDATRADKEHFTFGHGIHYCVGAPLARLEADIALPAIFDRYPQMQLALSVDELAPVESFIINGFRVLPVRLR